VEYQAADPGGGAWGVGGAAPGRDQGQAVDGEGLAVAHRPVFVGDAEGAHDAFLQQGADVLLRAVLHRGCHGVREHGDAGVAVLHPDAGLVHERRFIARQRERIARGSEALPEVALPAGQLVVREVVRLGIIHPGRVRA
jgi:hypothetical protein